MAVLLGCLCAAACFFGDARLAAAAELQVNPSQSLPQLQKPREDTAPVRIEEAAPAVPPKPGGPTILVRSFAIGGDSPVPPAELAALLQSDSGKQLSLEQLYALAGRLTSQLRKQGFLVAFAYLPAQEVKDGLVTFSVVPGRYGEIRVKGNAHVNDAFLRSLFHSIREGGIIRRDQLERSLLLAGDFPGIRVKTTLSPGKRSGTADFTIEAADNNPVSGAVYIDNWGSRYTGYTRYGAQVSYGNLSGIGDEFSVAGLTSFNGLNDYDIGYSLPVGRDGLRFSLHQSKVVYTLGDIFADMNANGQSNTTSAALNYPLVRSRAFNLNASLGFDHKRLRDDIESVDDFNPRTDNLWNIGIDGNFSDSWGGGGTNRFSLRYFRGNLALNDEAAAAIDEASDQTAGSFGKLLLTFRRQQFLRKNLQLALTFAGQLADKNLDSSEKFYLGGAGGVRAYPQGEAAGDQGYRFNAELQLLVPGWSTPRNQFFVNAFFDCGQVLLSKNPWFGDAAFRGLSGAGLGVLWVRDRDFSLKLDYAWKTSAEAAVSDTDKSGRLWLQAVKYF